MLKDAKGKKDYKKYAGFVDMIDRKAFFKNLKNENGDILSVMHNLKIVTPDVMIAQAPTYDKWVKLN